MNSYISLKLPALLYGLYYYVLHGLVKHEWHINLTKLHKYLSTSSLSLEAAICRAVFSSSILLKSAYSGNLVIHSSIALYIDRTNVRGVDWIESAYY